MEKNSGNSKDQGLRQDYKVVLAMCIAGFFILGTVRSCRRCLSSGANDTLIVSKLIGSPVSIPRKGLARFS